MDSLICAILAVDSTLGTLAEWRRPCSKLQLSFYREVFVFILILVLFLSAADFLPLRSPLLANKSFG